MLRRPWFTWHAGTLDRTVTAGSGRRCPAGLSTHARQRAGPPLLATPGSGAHRANAYAANRPAGERGLLRLNLRPGPTRRQAAGACTASRPSFVGGMAALKASLGPSMGDPIECERSVDDQGDTQQNTTTGLAYYRSQMNMACFTTGWDHWGLRDGGVVYWTGDSVDPPPTRRQLRTRVIFGPWWSSRTCWGSGSSAAKIPPRLRHRANGPA